MLLRTLTTHLLAALAGASLCGAVWWKTQADQKLGRAHLDRRVDLLQRENERLRGIVEKAEKTRRFLSDGAQRDTIEKSVTEIRGLEFKKPVDYNVLSRTEIKKVVADKLAELYSEQDFANMSAAFARLGLLPENYPLRQSYIDLLGEQIAAFYDQHQHKLFMFEDASLENSQNRIVLAHELMHALQDQHFNLLKLPLEIKDNDDRAIAASALVEGEATLVMGEFMLKNLSLGTLKDTVASSLAQDMEQLEKAPRFLRESLIFPYLRGQEFCAALFARGGYEALTRAYAAPPSSTAQILHPEKYLSEPREEPVRVGWGNTNVDNEAPAHDNVLGEFGTRMLIAEHADDSLAESAAEGWRGDRYLWFRTGDALVWRTHWASSQEALEFADAQQKVWEARYQPQAVIKTGTTYRSDAPRALRMVLDDSAVTIIDAPSAERAEQLLTRFAEETGSEMVRSDGN